MRSLFIVILLLRFAWAEVVITGEFTHFEDQRAVKDVQVAYQMEGSTRKSVLVANNGKYTITLDSVGTYIVSYEKSGFYTKKLKVLTTGIPEKKWKKGLKMLVDMDMVERMEGFDESVYYKPIGIAFYDPGMEDMIWETSYTRERFNIIDAAFKKLENKIEGEAISFMLPSVSDIMKDYGTLFSEPKKRNEIGLSLLKTAPLISHKKAFYMGQLSYHLKLASEQEKKEDVKAFSVKLNLLADQLHSDSLLTAWEKKIADGLNKKEVDAYINYLEKNILGNYDIHQIKLFQLGIFIEMLYAEMLNYQQTNAALANNFIGSQKKKVYLFNENLKQKSPFLGDKLMGLALDIEKLNAGFEMIPDEPKQEQLANDQSTPVYKFPKDWEILIQLTAEIRSKMGT